MTTKTVNLLLLVAIACVGAGYLFYSHLIVERRLGENLGPVMFPVTVGLGIVALSLIEILRSLRSRAPEDSVPFALPNAGKLAATIALIGLHIVIWQRFGLFYPATFGLFVALVLVFRATLAPREIGVAALWAGSFTLLVYLIFQRAFGIGLA